MVIAKTGEFIIMNSIIISKLLYPDSPILRSCVFHKKCHHVLHARNVWYAIIAYH
jgi:hypothetical protein